MPLTDQDRASLLAFYQERVASYANAGDGYASRWRSWCRLLLDHGGVLVVPPMRPERDLGLLLDGAVFSTSAARLVEGDPNACHANVSALWIDGGAEAIGTGYALSDDGLWRQHSWGVDADGTVVETTVSRVAYAGVTFSAAVSLQFATMEDPDRLKAVVRAGGLRAQQLTELIRATRPPSGAGSGSPP